MSSDCFFAISRRKSVRIWCSFVLSIIVICVTSTATANASTSRQSPNRTTSAHWGWQDDRNRQDNYGRQDNDWSDFGYDNESRNSGYDDDWGQTRSNSRISVSGSSKGTSATTTPTTSKSSTATKSVRTKTTTPKASTVTTQTGTRSACIAAAGAQIKDWDRSDPQDPPFAHTRGTETVVYFETGKLTGRFVTDVIAGAKAWSASPCIDGRTIKTCPANSNCVHITTGDGLDGDGETTGEFDGDVRTSSDITFDASEVGNESTKQALITITHEMGHAIGLSHRLSKTDLMYSASDEDTAGTLPDSNDMYNLTVLYGK